MRVLYKNIILLLLIIAAQIVVIMQNGRNHFVFDLVFLLGTLGMFGLNIYSIITLFKKVSLPVVIALSLSLFYYLLLFVFPIFSGSR